jgi:hypothetical protein
MIVTTANLYQVAYGKNAITAQNTPDVNEPEQRLQTKIECQK